MPSVAQLFWETLVFALLIFEGGDEIPYKQASGKNKIVKINVCITPLDHITR